MIRTELNKLSSQKAREGLSKLWPLPRVLSQSATNAQHHNRHQLALTMASTPLHTASALHTAAGLTRLPLVPAITCLAFCAPRDLCNLAATSTTMRNRMWERRAEAVPPAGSGSGTGSGSGSGSGTNTSSVHRGGGADRSSTASTRARRRSSDSTTTAAARHGSVGDAAWNALVVQRWGTSGRNAVADKLHAAVREPVTGRETSGGSAAQALTAAGAGASGIGVNPAASAGAPDASAAAARPSTVGAVASTTDHAPSFHERVYQHSLRWASEARGESPSDSATVAWAPGNYVHTTDTTTGDPYLKYGFRVGVLASQQPSASSGRVAVVFLESVSNVADDGRLAAARKRSWWVRRDTCRVITAADARRRLQELADLHEEFYDGY